jgi:SAM-dependent methyltransferase
VNNRDAWENEADAWLRWARAPDHDAYWQFREAFFRDLVPVAGRCTLEVGCGEGRVARDLGARGHRVVALDSSATLVHHANSKDSEGRYCLGDAAMLPFRDDSFDLAVAYNTLMDFDDLSQAVAEIARVLQPGGSLCICVPHPMLESGRFEDASADSPFRLTGSYFGVRPFDSIEERDGLVMHFTGWSRPLEEYVRVLVEAGFFVEDLREPVPESRTSRWEQGHRYPMFLNLRAVRRRS